MTMIRSGATGSMILWGPPGCGKTTLARLLAKESNAVFKELSATDSNIGEVRAVAEEAKNVLKLTSRRTILFLDEVHRFNKAQQDIFLSYIEQGVIQLIGATTENPSFKLTSALISRCRVFVLERLTDDDIKQIIVQAIRRVSDNPPIQHTDDVFEIPSSPLQPSQNLPADSSQSSTVTTASLPADVSAQYPQCTPEVIATIASLSNGDARTALSLLELVLHASKDSDPEMLLRQLRQSVSTSYDRTGDARYDMISALHKSVRGSQGSAAMYWLARMLSVGEDPMYIARRMVVCASEDIGLADPQALPLAVAAMQACQMIGMPECRINLAHIVAYLAEAPKSTRAYEAYAKAEELAKKNPTLPVPFAVRNAPTTLMKNLGYSEGYKYNPDYRHPVTNEYLPLEIENAKLLRDADDLSEKEWDEEALKAWELKENNGQPWKGRDEIKR
ncbi:P-loop containing nucleoside triphosphate hydrolase protein [Panus rudis PR-1116 ss-1]|nr:P-loop containing nucleoside triphosphate hydrolase protein [Panus rudis PR-1116 ss-1]